MPSLDFEEERSEFRDFYNDNSILLDEARQSLISLISALLRDDVRVSISKVEGRVKDREECIAKFIRKYRSDLEAEGESYSIKDHITDLIGIRVVCLYESDIDIVLEILNREFEVFTITNKTAEIEETDGTFGYKGMHADLRIKGPRAKFSEYKRYKDFQFEVQIRTLVQDAWSVIDHKIKYKRSIPKVLKRRINTLAALFELADREFLEIRKETDRQVEVAQESYSEIEKESADVQKNDEETKSWRPAASVLDAFSFLRIANHFFPDFDFEDRKVDGFVEEIQWHRANTTRGKFNFYMKNAISIVKEYTSWKIEAEGRNMNPFTLMRHCLFYGDPDVFRDMLAEFARAEFVKWLAENDSRWHQENVSK